MTCSDSHPDVLEYGSVYAFIRNGQSALGMYFLLGGRVLAHGFLRSAFAKPKPPKDAHGALIEGAPLPKQGAPKWLSLSSSLFRRSIRLALPAVIVGFIQWRVASDGLVTDAPQQATIQVLTPTALWTPAWANIGPNFADYLQFILDLFSSPNYQVRRSYAGSTDLLVHAQRRLGPVDDIQPVLGLGPRLCVPGPRARLTSQTSPPPWSRRSPSAGATSSTSAWASRCST